MIKVSIIVTTDKQGGIVGDVKSESSNITEQERAMLKHQREIYLDLLKRQVDALIVPPPPK
jgi:hypothetical protein